MDINLAFATKIGFLFLSFSYIVFLLIVFIQVLSMERIIKEVHDAIALKIIVLTNTALAIFLFVLAFVIL